MSKMAQRVPELPLVEELEMIFRTILGRTEQLVRAERGKEIRNERFYHHMFSSLLVSENAKRGIDVWADLLIRPEWPTKRRFRLEGIKLDSAESTRKNAIFEPDSKTGKCGNFDFAYGHDADEIALVEWKGPHLYEKREIVEVMIKLLSEERKGPRILAAVVTSSCSGRADHTRETREHLSDGLKFACEVCEIRELASADLSVYVASVHVPATDVICWGKCITVDQQLWPNNTLPAGPKETAPSCPARRSATARTAEAVFDLAADPRSSR